MISVFRSLIVSRIEEIVVRILLYMQLPYLAIEHVSQLIDVLFLPCRYEQTVVIEPRHPCFFQFVEGDVLLRFGRQVVRFLVYPVVIVNLVEDNHARFVGTSQVFQRLVYDVYLFLKVGMGDVYHVQKQVGFAHLVERRLKRVDQIGG